MKVNNESQSQWDGEPPLVEAYQPDPGARSEWRGLLRREGKNLIRDEENVRLVLANDPELIKLVRYNEFSGEMQLCRPIPDMEANAPHDTPRRWQDSDTVGLTSYIQRTTMSKVSRDRVDAALGYFARSYGAYHPLRDYLEGLTWDGKPRVATWLADYLGAGSPAPRLYLNAVGKAFLVSAVARVFEPGCQADCAMVLEGRQGIFKSSCLRILAGDEYFSDSLPADLKHKDSKDHLRGKWIIELPELAQFKRNEIETVKSFLSRRTEQYRPSYGRHEICYPRQCVFAGSTNEDHYLVDTTGNRRFWCVKCGDINLAGLTRDRDQLWAEAVWLYRQGCRWHLTDDAADAAAEEASERVALDPWTAMVAERVRLLPLMNPDVSPGEILESLDLKADQKHARNAARVAVILRDLGWRKADKRHRTRGALYLRPDSGLVKP
jgi:putative DNA primase/helicase